MFRVKALYEYSSPHEDDLSFPAGQIISVTEEEDNDWYVGEYTDASGAKQEGLFPKNFVEKYEPEPPPRPNRPGRSKQPEAAAAVEPPVESTPPGPVHAPSQELVESDPEPESEVKQDPKPEKSSPIAVNVPKTGHKEKFSPTSPTAVASAPKPVPAPAPAQPAVTSKPIPAPSAPTAKVPPAVAEKPSSFKDRIAAFNKPAAAPIAPFKPGSGSTTFIKKPFVAPPPSRHAYIPPAPRDVPQTKIYRREEDPEIAERQAQDLENAEKAGLAPTGIQEEDEDAPKPTSLKERIALLQKQQLEQARRSEASHKEKPKRPPKKRTESHGQHDAREEEEPAPLEQVTRVSTDASRESARDTIQRKSSQFERNQAPEILSDANDADQSAAGETTEDAEGTSTSVEDDDESKPRAPVASQKPVAAPSQESPADDEDGSTEEEDEVDEETRRRMELRERMAKMSGGMGMAGMFGGMPMGGAPPKKKKPAPPAPERKSTEDSVVSPPPQRIAMVPVPGMAHVRSPDAEDKQLAVEKDAQDTPFVNAQNVADDDVLDDEDVKPARTSLDRPPPPVPAANDRSAPPIPSAQRPIPPPVPSERPAQPAPEAIRSPSPGSESDDELTGPASETPVREAPPPIPVGSRPDPHTPVQSPPLPKRTSYIGGASETAPPPPPSSLERRTSRVPPIPGSVPAMSPAQSRAPPPPPPTSGPPSRQPTFNEASRHDDEEGETEYEGDYDTDIAPGATHKDALKSHARESSLDESTTADDRSLRSPGLPPSGPPPLPSTAAPRAVPPPPPTQPPRRSVDAPRAVPPPVPSTKGPAADDDDDYDPYRYAASPPRGVPPVPRAPASSAAPPPAFVPPPPPPPRQEDPASDDDNEDDDLYSSPPPRKSTDRPSQAPPAPPSERQPPPPPPSQAPPPHERYLPPPPPPPSAAAPVPTQPTSRKSLDVSRLPLGSARRSMDQPRPSTDTGFIANDVDLSHGTQWWTQPNAPPPVFQNRKDVLFEVEESTSSKRGGKATVTKDVYVLFQDYSQTIVSVQFDARDPADVSLEQRHEGPPKPLRQDQLENAHSLLGQRIADDVASKQNTVVGDGTPHGLIYELLRPHRSALSPVGTRSYGALVYANLANASVQQHDEIRPGDIISFRNAKFEGKHGPMHAKYKMEVGKPDHVGIVSDWDGTKKKVRAYEQGRENKKVKLESFRVGDLRSGEVRVWRVMSRGWVGWEGESN